MEIDIYYIQIINSTPPHLQHTALALLSTNSYPNYYHNSNIQTHIRTQKCTPNNPLPLNTSTSPPPPLPSVTGRYEGVVRSAEPYFLWCCCNSTVYTTTYSIVIQLRHISWPSLSILHATSASRRWSITCILCSSVQLLNSR